MTTPSDQRAQLGKPSGELANVCWTDPEGRKTTAPPLPEESALALAAAFGHVFPRDRYWVEPVPWLIGRDDH
jgi:hypothetical protein